MRLAALYDIHGNATALSAVLTAIESARPDAIIIGGDVLPGPQIVECLDLIACLSVQTYFVAGNGERECLAMRRGVEPRSVPLEYWPVLEWCARRLSAEQATWLSTWQQAVRLDHPALGRALFCHATPRSDTDVFTRLTPEGALISAFDGCDADTVLCGHTHMQFDRMVGRIRVINAGSVGLPFGRPLAQWLWVDACGAQLRSEPYDIDGAAERIARSDYPEAGLYADRFLRRPESEEKMLALFTHASFPPRATTSLE